MDRNPDAAEAHPLSEKQTRTEDSKLSTTIAAVADPKFPLPILDEKSSYLRYILSFGTFGALLGGGVLGAWFLEVAILQTQPTLVLVVAFFVMLGAFFLTGTVWVDWYELVLGYWWLSMPIGAAAGLALVMNQEQSVKIDESS